MYDLMGRRIQGQLVRSSGQLLEREAELAELSAAFDQARLGRGSVVAIDGPPGIGKSRLLAEAAALAHAGGLEVLMAAGRDIESQFPFGVVLQWFEARVADADESERLDLLAGAATAAAPQLVPGLGDDVPSHERDAFSVLRGLYQVCVNLGRVRPLVLIVDDAQHADRLSLRFALYLAQRLEDLPVCLVVAGSLRRLKPTAQYLAELLAHPMTRMISPPPLSPEGVALAMRQAPFPEAGDEFCRSCFDVTGGNPFLLHALAADLAVAREHDTRDAADVLEAGPESVAQSVLLRLDTIGPGAIPFAQAVAVLGDEVELRHAAEVAGLEPLYAARLADELMHADVLARGELLSFVYPIVRSAVAAAMLPAERAAANLSAARVLDLEGAPLEKVAGHLLQASRTGSDWVVGVLSAAAQAAMTDATPESAVRYLRRALSEPPDQGQRATLMLRLGRAEALLALPEAVPHLREALSVTREPADRAVAALGIGRLLWAQGRSAEAAATLRKACAELNHDEVTLSSQLMGTHALCVRLGPTADDLDQLSRSDSDAHAESPDSPWGRIAIADRALARALGGHPVDEVLGLARNALGRGQLLDCESADGLGYYVATSALTVCEDYQTAEFALTAAIEEASGRGSALGGAIARGFRALAIFGRGRLLDAEADAEDALGAAPQTFGFAFPAVTAVLAEVLMERGELGKAEKRLAVAQVPDRLGVLDLLWLAADGRLLRKRGDFAGALARFERCAAVLAEAGVENPAVLSWRTEAALAAAGMADEHHARRLLDEELELARSFGAPGAIGFTLHAAALLRTGARRVGLLSEALEYLETSQRALARARVLVELGATLRRNGRRRASQDPLRQGLELAHRCGAPILARRALEEIRATGSRPRRTALSGADALTPRERQVAELAARGLSNREIARALYVTVKTVEWHLRNAFNKLEVGSRRELAAAVPAASDVEGEGPEPLASEDAAET
jgi:DNA-binding CsgD family transcriptional regulator